MKSIAVLLLLPALLAVAGCAQTPPGAGGYGAIAYSPATQKWRVRWNVERAARAIDLAVRECGQADCRAILTFGPAQCGTFALGKGGALGVGTGASAKQATETALAQCARTGSTCKAAPVHCNR